MRKFPGMIFDEPNEVYHANAAVSFSKLKTFRQRASLFKKKYLDKKVENVTTEPMLIGSATHTLVLEGAKAFYNEYVVLPEDHSNRTKAGGYTPLKHDTYLDLMEYRESVHANPVAHALLSQGLPEIGWRLNGEHCALQCRTDWFCEAAPDFDAMGIHHMALPLPGVPYVVDYKTTQSLDDWVSEGWNNTIHKMGYDGQEAFYRFVMNGIRAPHCEGESLRWYFVVTEKQEPRETAVFVLDSGTLTMATNRVHHDIHQIEQCFKDDEWPGMGEHTDGAKIIVTGVPEHIRMRSL